MRLMEARDSLERKKVFQDDDEGGGCELGSCVGLCLMDSLRPPVLGGWDFAGFSVTQGHWGHLTVVEGRSFSAKRLCSRGSPITNPRACPDGRASAEAQGHHDRHRSRAQGWPGGGDQRIPDSGSALLAGPCLYNSVSCLLAGYQSSVLSHRLA